MHPAFDCLEAGRAADRVEQPVGLHVDQTIVMKAICSIEPPQSQQRPVVCIIGENVTLCDMLLGIA